MSYFNMVEFLVKEVAKANEQIESLTRKAEDDKSVIDRLCKVHDKYFSEAKSAKADLEEMTIEKDHWKEEALEYRDKESNWWKEEKQYKAKIKGLSDDFDRLNDDVNRIKRECIELETDYVCEANLVSELEDELADVKSKVVDANQYRIKVVGELEDKLSLTEKRYKSVIEQFTLSDKRYQDKIAELQLEINHLKNNK